MAEWYSVMFPKAKSEDDLVPLYRYRSPLGNWEVHTAVKTFRYQPFKQPNDFYLFWADDDDSKGHFHSVFDAIKAVYSHTTGVEAWDNSSIEVTDYLGDWQRRKMKRVIFNYIDQWIAKNPGGDLRGMVDYFEHDDTVLVNRLNISDFLKEMIVTGQLTALPGTAFAPAELHGIIRLAEKYGICRE
jgi:hypothetical protein